MKVSNISDVGYLGIESTLAHMAPFLEAPQVNKHATLITLFMNAVDETRSELDVVLEISPDSPRGRFILEYLPPEAQPYGPEDPWVIKYLAAHGIVGAHDHIFHR